MDEGTIGQLVLHLSVVFFDVVSGVLAGRVLAKSEKTHVLSVLMDRCLVAKSSMRALNGRGWM